MYNPDDRPRLSFDQRHFGRDITCRGVYQAFDGRWHGYDFNGTLRTVRTGPYGTELEARRQLQAEYLFRDYHAWTMWSWMTAGDCAPSDSLTRQQQRIVGGIRTRLSGERNILRINGVHYTFNSVDRKSNKKFRGFGGRTFRWRWLNEPEGTIHFSDDMWTQGDVPDMMRHLLPDNAVWITETDIMMRRPAPFPGNEEFYCPVCRTVLNKHIRTGRVSDHGLSHGTDQRPCVPRTDVEGSE